MTSQNSFTFSLLLLLFCSVFSFYTPHQHQQQQQQDTVSFSSSSPKQHSSTHNKVVYQHDDRTDICDLDPSSVFSSIARQAIAAIMPTSYVAKPEHGNYNSFLQNYHPLGTRQNLCPEERFRDQPTAALCSATLVAPDRVVTAGHCITDSSCADRAIVFNYFLDGPMCVLANITVDDVYRCARAFRVEHDTFDYAIIHLDRPVSNRVPAPVWNAELPMLAHQHITVMGFGSGIPLKVDQGGHVIDPRAKSLDYFVANTDTFAGNSGSGVFDDCGRIVGVLVRGQTDYVQTENGCRVVVVTNCVDEMCTGLRDAEEISYVFRALREVTDCKTSSDCASTEYCERSCAADAHTCTGWCVAHPFAPSAIPCSTPTPTKPSPSASPSLSPSSNILSLFANSTHQSLDACLVLLQNQSQYFDLLKHPESNSDSEDGSSGMSQKIRVAVVVTAVSAGVVVFVTLLLLFISKSRRGAKVAPSGNGTNSGSGSNVRDDGEEVKSGSSKKAWVRPIQKPVEAALSAPTRAIARLAEDRRGGSDKAKLIVSNSKSTTD